MVPIETQSRKADRRPILIIEDDLDDQFFIRETLKEVGVTKPVMMMRNGQEAIDYLFPRSELNKLPCLIILDLGLPDIRGLDLLKHLRGNQETSAIPVIVMTNSHKPEDITGCYSTGANSFIRKTFNPDEFREEMKLFVTYWLDLCQLPA